MAVRAMKPPTISAEWTNSAEEFARHIAARSGQYFDDIAEQAAQVRLLRTITTRNSRLLEFRVTDGRCQHDVIAKIPYAARRLRQLENKGQTQADRPRLFPRADTHLKGLHEFVALRAIHEHFTRLRDARFAAIRPLDALHRPATLIMEKSRDVTLRHAWHQASRFSSRSVACDLLAGFRNAGAWLRRFHELPPVAHTEPHGTTRADFTAAVQTLSDYLLERTADHQFLRRLRDGLLDKAQTALPARLPLGLVHGDFAAHNVLSGPRGRVTVFDTQARWQAPIYSDLAHFLVALKVNAWQICTSGWFYHAVPLAQYEQQLLRGYFGEATLPRTAIRLFESLNLLEWWAALAFHHQAAKGMRRVARFWQLRFCGRYLSRYLSPTS